MAKKESASVHAAVRSAHTEHPLAGLQWLEPTKLHANGYNPNKVFGPEFELLKTSLLEDGWTQPIVARPDFEIVDGFHRWTIASRFPEVLASTGGLVPVVFLQSKDVASQMISTVRHNRARGQHGILKMGTIVRGLRSEGLPDAEIMRRLGMEDEEVERLTDVSSSPNNAGRDSFGRGWVPTDSNIAKRAKAKNGKTV